jgi:S-adenosylmethionine hydrolase
MAGAKVRMDSTPGNEQILIQDFWGQYIKMVAKAGNQRIELSDKFGNVITMVDGKITLLVPDGAHVNVGGEDGQQLATKAFVETYYNEHTHVSTMPGSLTTPPVILAPRIPGVDVTKKQLSE